MAMCKALVIECAHDVSDFTGRPAGLRAPCYSASENGDSTKRSVVTLWDDMVSQFMQNQVLCLAFNEAKDELYSGSEDTAIKVWDVQHGRLIRKQEGHRSWVTDMLFAADMRLLFSCSLDHTVIVWTDRGQRMQVKLEMLPQRIGLKLLF